LQEDQFAVAGPSGKIAAIVLAVLRCDQRSGDLAGGNGIHRTTVTRWVREVVGLLAARAPRLDRALKKIAHKGGGVVLLDGTLNRTRRRTGKENRKNYSGKSKCHGLLVISLTDNRGRLLWVSAARPGRTSEITACRHDQLTAKLRAAGLGAIADLGFVGLDDSSPDADLAVITGYKAARNRPLTRGQKLSNTALAAVRAPVEHGFAHLKNWRVLGRSAPTRRGRPPWSGPCASSQTAKFPGDRRSSPKSSTHDHHEHPEPRTHQTRDQQLHDAHCSMAARCPQEAPAGFLSYGHQLAGYRPAQQEDAALRTPRCPSPARGAHRVRGPVPGRPPGADGVPPGPLRRQRLPGRRALGHWSAYGAPPLPWVAATARAPAAPGPAPPCRGSRVPAVPVRSCGGTGAPGKSGSPARGPTASA
jgi:hypothetical protein